MTDYSEMYHKLFNRVTDIIEELQDIQRQTEELYMEKREEEMIPLRVCSSEEAKGD